MPRALVFALLLLVAPAALSAQTLVTLHIKAVLMDATGRATPVGRHALLISDNPQTVSTRRIVTTADGTAEISVRPGSYTIESDQPVTLGGKSYSWTETLTIAPGRDAVLELTAANADVEVGAPGPSSGSTPDAPATTAAASSAASSSLAVEKWRDSVVAIWTPTAHATAFIVDSRGLLATNQQAVGSAMSVEVQFSPTVKVPGSVVASDKDRDIAVIRIDPAVMTPPPALPLDCARTDTPALANKQEISTLATPLLRDKRMAFGEVSRITSDRVTADLTIDTGSAGSPVFSANGDLVGITAPWDEGRERIRGEARVVPVSDVCRLLTAAQAKLIDPAPAATRLPVEPARQIAEAALKEAMKGRAGSLAPYKIAATDFDVTLLTPLNNYVEQSKAATDFSNWQEYVAAIPPVLLIRVTPRLSEGFWTKVGRAAASTQGMDLPKIERYRSGFLRMRALCGSTEVTPIHPFKLERRASEREAIFEGLYVFDPAALGPNCGTVSLVLYSEKEPAKTDTRVVDPRVLSQIARDFELTRR